MSDNTFTLKAKSIFFIEEIMNLRSIFYDLHQRFIEEYYKNKSIRNLFKVFLIYKEWEIRENNLTNNLTPPENVVEKTLGCNSARIVLADLLAQPLSCQLQENFHKIMGNINLLIAETTLPTGDKISNEVFYRALAEFCFSVNAKFRD